MNIIVVGCGKIGTTIISSLVDEGHSVTAVDTSAEAVEEITNIYDVFGVCGNGADFETLVEASAAKTHMVVAVTGSDEINMLSCFMAKKLGVDHTIARIRNPEYNDDSLGFIKEHLELSMAINPELLAASELFNVLKLPSAVKVETFSRRGFEIIELILKENSPLDGIKLCELSKKYKTKVLIGAVQRGDKVYIPDGSFMLKSGDKIGIAATKSDIQRLLKSLNILQKQAKNVMILGGSRTAFYLTKMLCDIGTSVKIIEKDENVCRELCEALPKSVVINGDGAEQELLREEGIHSMDAFVSLTGMDEENILISIFASSQNVPKVISKVNREELSSMAEKLGLDCIVSPKKIIDDILVRYARALHSSLDSNVETLYTIMDDMVEALEFFVKPESKLVNIPLKDLKIKPNILIAAIFRDKEIIVPSGNDIILPGDKVIVLAADIRLSDLSDIIK